MHLHPGSASSDVAIPVAETDGRLPDGQLWEDFKKGSGEAYARIYHSLVQDLYSYGLHVANQPEMVEDCIQDLFIYIWDTKENLGRTDNIKFYLFRALKRRILLKIAEKHKTEVHLKTAGRDGEKEEAAAVDQLFTANPEADRSAALEKALQVLTPRQREAIYLRFYDKLSYAEIAAIMSITTQSTYSLIARSMEVLRGQMRLVLAILLMLRLT